MDIVRSSMDKDDASGGEAVVKFDDVVAITPKGKYSVELHLSFFRLHGHANDFKIQYSSVVRLFLLPKSKRPHTFVVVTLDPPIREGPTLYPHIVLQFEKDFVVESTLVINKDLLISDYKDRLEASYKGLIHEVFTMILHGLSRAKVTRPGNFCSHKNGYAVKCSLKDRVGLLYPLKKELFFLPKLPTRILIDEINDVDFERHGTGGRSMYYFDLRIRLKNRREHVFLNILKDEFDNLYEFLSEKQVRLRNLDQNQDVSPDPHIERLKYESALVDESDEEEDYVPENDSCGSSVDDSEEEESDGIESEDLNIPKDEFDNLFEFLSEKRVRLRNLDQNLDVSPDPYIERLKYESAFVDESDEEEDYVPENDSCGSSEEEESDDIESEDLNIHEDDNASGESDGLSTADDSGENDSDAIVSGEEKEEPRKEASTSELVLDKKRSRDGNEDGLEKRKEVEKKSHCLKDSNTRCFRA